MTASIDTKLRFIGPLVLFVCGTLFFRLNTLLDFNYADLYRYDLVGIVAGFVNWHISRWVLLRLQARYPGIELTRRRCTIYGLLLPMLVVIGTLLRTEPLGWLGIEPSTNTGLGWFNLDSAGTTSFRQYVLTAGIQLFYHGIYWGVYEGIYLFRQWQQLYQEKERLIKAEWQARFDALKSQVNPHFLFNALNALSALIDESPAQAGQYVDQLAKVYRYLLQANELELTSLADELSFIESYAHLLRTRYGAGFTLQVEVPAHDQPYLMPPLTLQLLVENAVKHNVVQVKYPLLVEIKTTSAGWLMVRNNLQPKRGRVLSNGVGLSSIATKYEMMGQPEIAIQEADGYFTVLLPLIQC